MCAEVFHTLKSILKKTDIRQQLETREDLPPDLVSDEEALSYIVNAIEKAGYIPEKILHLQLMRQQANGREVCVENMSFPKSKILLLLKNLLYTGSR